MRTLSKKTQYGLRALYYLTRHYEEGPILISRLARDEAVPHRFLQQILLHLKKNRIVGSRKGRGGGYFLLQPPEQVSLGFVIRRMEGPLAPLPCASETAFRKCDDCLDAESCGTRLIMREVRDATARILDSTTLADVCRKVDSLRELSRQEPALMYYI